MTTPTNEPEETATPETEAVWRVCTQYGAPTQVNMLYASSQRQEKRAIRAERERDELREMLDEILAANESPSITGFAQACEKARALLNRTKPAQ